MSRTLFQHRNAETPPSPSELDSGLNILFLAAFPLLAWLFQGSFYGIATALVQMWLMTVAVRMIASGQKKHHAYKITPGAKAPRLPRKLLGALLLGLMVMLLAGHRFDDLAVPALIGALAVALSLLAFGLDPMTDKPSAESAQHTAGKEAELALERTDHALSQIADRIAMLEDAELTRRTEAARHMVMRLMRGFARDPQALQRLQRPVDKFVRLLDDESNKICMGDLDHSATFARRRYIAKLEVMSESFETSARKLRVRGDKDAFEVEADILLNRMPRNSAA